MKPYKSSEDDYVSAKGLSRLRLLKWWFILLIVLGILALILVLSLQGSKTAIEFQKGALSIFAVSMAYAQDSTENMAEAFTPRVIIIAGVFSVLGIVYLAGIFKLFFSGNPGQVDTAADLVKTLTGFFVGAATGFLG